MQDDPYDVTPDEVLAAFPPGYLRDFWLQWAIQHTAHCGTAWTRPTDDPHHLPMRVLAHIKKLDDCFGDFLVRVSCVCGASRHIEPEALARLVGWSMTLETLAQRMRCSQCGKKTAEVVAVARPRPRGVPKNPH